MEPTRLFTLHMLGPLEIRVGERLPALRRKERALLAYLAATERAHQRRALADMFCQEADAPDRALRLLLSRIRREVHPLALVLDGATVRFNPQIGEVDFLAFTRVLEGDLGRQTIAALEAAVAPYRGELLAGLSLADAPEFELWLLGERARLRLLYERGLNELVSRLIAASQYAAAIERAQQLLQSNPLLEEAHAQLIWLYAQIGQRSAALRQFALCRDLLQRELAVEPAPSLRALYAEVAAGRLGPRAAPAPATGPAPADWRKPAACVGREAELEQLRRAWEGVRHRRGMAVLVEAEAGGGKTRLVHEFAGRAGLRLLSGRCSESMAPLPYHPWIEVLEEYQAATPGARLDQLSPFARDYLARLVPGLARRSRSAPPAAPTAGGEIERLFTAILECFEQGGPLVIFIDDLQWIDETSLRLFHFIATRARRMRLLLVGTLRSAEADDAPALQTLLHDLQRQALLHLQLAALGEDAIRLLIAQGWPALPEAHHAAAATMLAQATQGNALFVTEIIAELAHATQVPSELPIPASVRELVQRRFRQLPPSGRQALEGLAVLASPATLTQAQLISGRAEEEAALAIDLGLRRGLLHVVGDARPARYAFRHDLVQKVVVDQLSPVRAELLHRRVAWQLEQSGARAALLAYHWGMAGDAAREGHYAAMAGEQAAAVYASDDALRYLERALELIDDPERRVEVMCSLGSVRVLIGRWPEAEVIYREALALAEHARSRTLLARCQAALGKLMAFKGLYPQALAWLEPALAFYKAVGDQTGMALALNEMAAVHVRKGDYDQSLLCYSQALQIDQELGNQAGVASSVSGMGVVYWYKGAYEQALACYERSLDIRRQLGNKPGVALLIGNMGLIYWNQGAYEQALDCYGQALQIDRELGNTSGVARHLGNMGLIYWNQGAYEQALDCYGQALQIDQELGNTSGMAAWVGNMGIVYQEQGAFAQALACYGYALQVDAALGHKEGVFRQLGNMAVAHAEHGDLGTAESLIQRAIALGRSLDTRANVCEFLSVYADLCARQQRYHEGQRLADESLQIATEIGRKDIQLSAQLLRTRLRVACKLSDSATATQELLPLIRAWPEEPDQAAIHYEIWRLEPSQATARQAASSLYRDLYARTPKSVYRQRYEEMTGETLPDPPALPPVPELVPADPIDLEAILAQFDHI